MALSSLERNTQILLAELVRGPMSLSELKKLNSNYRPMKDAAKALVNMGLATSYSIAGRNERVIHELTDEGRRISEEINRINDELRSLYEKRYK